MNNEPCKICGNTDMNLIDGFYYCVECGTQDANVVETLVEDINVVEGTLIARRTKVTKIKRTVEKVTPEWSKWQAYNYILAGLVKEVIDLGAGPKFKMRVMWLWTLYVKKFQKKKELGLSEEDDEIIMSTRDITRVRKQFKGVRNRLKCNIVKVTGNFFITLIYLALNFDRSEILLSDLIRYIREGRISSKNSIKYVPQELDVSDIEHFKLYQSCSDTHFEYFNYQAMTLIKTLELGPPIVPDLSKIAERYIKELCLPEGFKDLVLSLIDLVPCDYLDLDEFIMQEMNQTPFYEARIMAYILVALKMCFGLDDEYEIKLSDAVDRINNENCHMKCYKLGVFSTSSDRLFSFREWVKFLQLRRLILSRCYLPLAHLFHMDVDDYTIMEQRVVPIPFRKKPSLIDDLIMSIINKIKTDPRKEIIPKNAFCHSLTPLTTYTEVVSKYHSDPEIRLLLSEDFTQYSLRYAYEDLDLRVSDGSGNIIVGIDAATKCIKSEIKSKVNLSLHRRNSSLVYIRNCENKNWLKTTPPSINHFKKISRENNNDENINSVENETDSEIEETDDITDNNKLEFIEENLSENIFDDDFENLEEYEERRPPELLSVKSEPIDDENNSRTGDNLCSDVENQSLNFDGHSSMADEDIIKYFFNPETFDREEAIKELVLLTCKKYKAPVPNGYKEIEKGESRKRKAGPVNKENEEGAVTADKPKKKRAKPGEAKAQIDVLLSAYHDSLRHDVFSSVAHYIKDLVENSKRSGAELNIDQVDGDFENNLDYSQNEYNDDNEHDNAKNYKEVNTHNNAQIDEPSLIEIQNRTVDDSVDDEATNAYKGDPKFDDKIYDIKQLYIKVDDENLTESMEDFFNVEDDSDVDKVLSKKIDELATNDVSTANSTDETSKDLDDKESLGDLKEQMETNKVREDAYKNLEYLVKNREEITKNNYWSRHEKVLVRVQNMSDSFTNDMKENYPSSFSFIIIECAAMLDTTPFVLYKNMLKIEDFFY